MRRSDPKLAAVAAEWARLIEEAQAGWTEEQKAEDHRRFLEATDAMLVAHGKAPKYARAARSRAANRGE